MGARPFENHWLALRRCPVLRLEGNMQTEERLARIHDFKKANRASDSASPFTV